LQTGRTEETQVIPQTLRLDLIIVLGTLAPDEGKTYLRQMGAKNILAPDGGQTYLRQMGGTYHKL
jgi:hypothetical protein